MMVMTTFSFDDNSKWMKYAMVTPVTKRDLVSSKFIVLLIFSKARTLSLVSFIVPAAICFGVYEIQILFGVSFTDQFMFILLCCSPVIALAWNLAMFKISYVILSKKDLLYS